MIDTNLIIGRLGSGKTSCIKHLINNKPNHEKWAIIVNEFGQIGIDAALLEPESTEELNISEIAGGCICCAAQSQLHVTLTRLIRQYKPDRILIEATGLGHPAGIIDLLRDEFLHRIININSILSIIDLTLFKNLTEINSERSPIKTESFKHQNQLADIVVLNKSDLASESDFENAYKYLDSIYPEKTKILSATNGNIDNKWLTLISDIPQKEIPYSIIPDHHQSKSERIYHLNIPIESFFSENEGLVSFGYILPAKLSFNRKNIQSFIDKVLNDDNIEIIRLKAVLNCGRFWYGFNGLDQKFETTESFYRRDNRIEFISSSKHFDRDKLRDNLFNCIKQS